MGLDREIEARRAEVRTDGYPMSIGELINLYRDEELDIHPEFQRWFRWSQEQKSRLIEVHFIGDTDPFDLRFPTGGWCLGRDRWATKALDNICTYR